MADPIEDRKLYLHDAIQDTSGSQSETDGAVLTGYVVISEWTDPEGKKWLSAETSQGGGEQDAPPWVWLGWLQYAMSGGFN